LRNFAENRGQNLFLGSGELGEKLAGSYTLLEKEWSRSSGNRDMHIVSDTAAMGKQNFAAGESYTVQ
jgi:hypothetical protein